MKKNKKVKKSNNDKTKKYNVEDVKNKKTNSNNNDETKKIKNKKIKTNKKGKVKKHKILKRVILAIFLLGIIAVMVVAGIVAGIFFSDKYKVTREDLDAAISGNTKIVNGDQVVILASDENREWVDLDKMPEYLPNAFIAIEDKRFREHNGIDIGRTISATLNFAAKGGESSYGGSTITQQLIKNTFDDKDDEGVAGIERKIREMARAYNLEKVLSKDEILEYYLNLIFIGGTNYGVSTATHYYFSKTIDQLSLAQAAFLAGINHAPNAYAPFDQTTDNTEKIKTRTKTVLAEMKSQGFITDEETYNAAVAEVDAGLGFAQGQVNAGSNYSYHTAAVIEQVIKDLMEKDDIDYTTAKNRFYNSGYTVYSTVNNAIQARMEEEFKKDKYIIQPKETRDGKPVNTGHTQSAMVIIDHKTGQVVGCVGGLGTDASVTGTNRATQGKKQPGSSFKPIAVVAPAIDMGIVTAATVYDDSYTRFGGGYDPHNSYSGGLGLITVRRAIGSSSNIVNVKILAEVGPSNAIEFLKKLRINVSDHYNDLALALGTPAVSPLEMAAAYATIANDGVYIEPTFYTKVEDSEGNVILEPQQETERVLSEQNAYILKRILTEPVRSGTAGTCAISGMDVCAKTGSTEEYKDRWLCGFTPYYTAACWYGFDNAECAHDNNNARAIWAAVMKDIHSGLPSARIQKPENITSATICLDSGCVATASCARRQTEEFVIGTVPGPCEGHKTLKICTETGKIANEYCKAVEDKTFLVRPPKENTTLWTTSSGGKYDVPTETCTVHVAPEQVEVVDVVGKKLAAAKEALEDIGFVVNVEYSENEDEDDGIVLKQSVKAKQKADKGSTITLTVNKKKNTNTNTNTTNEVGGGTTNTEKPSTNANTQTNTSTGATNTQTPPTTNTAGGDTTVPSSNIVE